MIRDNWRRILNFFECTASSAVVRENERGAVLIVVLWVLLAISLLALSFSASIRTEVDAARNVVEQKQSHYLARAGIEYAVYEIIKTQSAFYQSQTGQGLGLDSIPAALRGFMSLELTGGRADIRIIDETGKINVNAAPDHLVFNLLLMVGVDPEQADVITDSILDWQDPDELVSPFGAESDYYQSLPEPYVAKNGFFDLPEELLLVRGVTPEIYYGRKALSEAGDPIELYGLQHYLTTFTASPQINLNSAPVPVLAAVPGLGYSVAVAIDEMRAEMPFTNPGEIAEMIPGLSTDALSYLGIATSGVYTIRSFGSLENSQVTSQIRAVIQVGGVTRKGYAVLYWNEANTEL
jgi:general secretion pathway protein K